MAALESFLTRNWWAFVLRGIIAIIFGIVAVIWPDLTVASLIIIFGVYALVDGVFAIASAIVNGGGGRWLPYLLIGLAGIIIGLMTLFWPGLTALALIYFIGAWMVVSGVFQIIGAIQVRREISNEVWLILSGILSVLVGLYLMVFPGAGAIALIWVIGVYAIIFGIMLIVLGFTLRNRRGGSVGTAGLDADTPSI